MEETVKNNHKSLKLNIANLSFNILTNTILSDLPDHLKERFKQAMTHGYKTEELKFLHSRVNGLVVPPFITEEQLRNCSTFKTRPGDVFLITYPKSGTIWLSEIVYSITKQNNSNQEYVTGGAPMFEAANLEQLQALPSPRYISTHLPFSLVPHNSEHNLKYIYLARNPKDVAVSIYYFMRDMIIFDMDATWEEFFGYFMKGDLPGGSYFDHVLECWEHKDEQNVLFLKYEDLKNDLKGQVKIIAEFLGFNLSDKELEAVVEKCTFQAMKSNSNLGVNNFAKFFKRGSHLRKGIVGDWKNHFSDKQLKEFHKLYEFRMNGTGLDFEFESTRL